MIGLNEGREGLWQVWMKVGKVMTGLNKGREGYWQVCIKVGKVYDRFE